MFRDTEVKFIKKQNLKPLTLDIGVFWGNFFFFLFLDKSLVNITWGIKLSSKQCSPPSPPPSFSCICFLF